MTLPATFTIAPSQRNFLILIGAVLCGFRVAEGDYVFAAVLGAAFLFAYFVQGTFRVEVTESGISRSGGLWFKKSATWPEVAAIDETGLLGGHSLRITTLAGDRFRLPAPFHGFLASDSAYADKVELIQNTWREHTTESPSPTGA